MSDYPNDMTPEEILEEDRKVVERLTKAKARYSFMVDVSGMSPEKAQEYLKKVKRQVKGKNPLDPGNDTFH